MISFIKIHPLSFYKDYVANFMDDANKKYFSSVSCSEQIVNNCKSWQPEDVGYHRCPILHLTKPYLFTPNTFKPFYTYIITHIDYYPYRFRKYCVKFYMSMCASISVVLLTVKLDTRTKRLSSHRSSRQ